MRYFEKKIVSFFYFTIYLIVYFAARRQNLSRKRKNIIGFFCEGLMRVRDTEKKVRPREREREREKENCIYLVSETLLEVHTYVRTYVHSSRFIEPLAHILVRMYAQHQQEPNTYYVIDSVCQ